LSIFKDKVIGIVSFFCKVKSFLKVLSSLWLTTPLLAKVIEASVSQKQKALLAGYANLPEGPRCPCYSVWYLCRKGAATLRFHFIKKLFFVNKTISSKDHPASRAATGL
jgi:hypothetical protein